MDPKDPGQSSPLTPMWFGDGQPVPPPVPPDPQSPQAQEPIQATLVEPTNTTAAVPVPPPPPPEFSATAPSQSAAEPLAGAPAQPPVGDLTTCVPAPTVPVPPAFVPREFVEPPASVTDGVVATDTDVDETRTSAPAAANPAPKPFSIEPADEGPETTPPLLAEEEVLVEEESLLRLYLAFAPAWLTSFIVHMSLIIGLAAIVLAFPTKPPPVVINLHAFEETNELAEEMHDLQEVAIPEEVVDETPEEPVEIVEAEPEEIITPEIVPEDSQFAMADEFNFEPIAEMGELQPHGVSNDKGLGGHGRGKNMLSGRTKGNKRKLLRRFGGTPQTEAAVEAGLNWLTRQQLKHGGWRLDGPYADGSGSRNPNAATAMALLAFQGAGYTHKTGDNRRHRQVVKRGWYWLLRQQGQGGHFAKNTGSHEHYYTHALCTFAICELYAMTRDNYYRTRAQAAVDYLVRNQDEAGGWRYRGGGSDLSVSGWVMMALQSARMGYLKVPQETLDRYSAYLDRVSSKYGSRYAYTGGSPSLAMTAEGLLCRQYLGWRRDNGSLVNGAEYLLDNPIDYQGSKNLYYWYYATQVLHHMEGKMWREWNHNLRTQVPAQQVKQGREHGSWSPRGVRHGGQGGRLYTTCLSIYMLEVYYRHLPIYSKDISPLERNRRDRQEAAEAAAEEEAAAAEAEEDEEEAVPLDELLEPDPLANAAE